MRSVDIFYGLTLIFFFFFGVLLQFISAPRFGSASEGLPSEYDTFLLLVLTRLRLLCGRGRLFGFPLTDINLNHLVELRLQRGSVTQREQELIDDKVGSEDKGLQQVIEQLWRSLLIDTMANKLGCPGKDLDQRRDLGRLGVRGQEMGRMFRSPHKERGRDQPGNRVQLDVIHTIGRHPEDTQVRGESLVESQEGSTGG